MAENHATSLRCPTSKILGIEKLSAQSRQSAKLFLQSSELGLPQPLTRRECAPPPPRVWGAGHTRWGWESPNFDEGTYIVVLFIYMYFVAECVVCLQKDTVCKGYKGEMNINVFLLLPFNTV